MRALTFGDIGRVAMADVAAPVVEEPGDAVVRVTTAAICGSDLHVLNGRIPGMSPGAVLGHEFIGVVEQVGEGVSRVRVGDRVLASFVIPCGSCWFCGRGLFSRCPDQRVFGYGMFLGDLDGAQAEQVRVPNADLCLRTLTDDLTDEAAIFAGDIFTTGLDAASEGRVEPGDVVVVQGCGPVGLMTVQALRAFQPSAVYAVDMVAQRLEMAESFGAIPVDAARVHLPSHIQDHTGGRGADVVIECVGAIPALAEAIEVVRPGGRISVIGVYSEPEMELPLNLSFVKAIDLKFCGTANIIGRWDRALAMIRDGSATPAAIVSHRLPLEEAEEGYRLFAARQALKVLLVP